MFSSEAYIADIPKSEPTSSIHVYQVYTILQSITISK
jgi:hypothetical protein